MRIDDLESVSLRELGYHAHECDECGCRYPCFDIACADLKEALCADCAEGTYDPWAEHRNDEVRVLLRQNAAMDAGRELGLLMRKKTMEVKDE